MTGYEGSFYLEMKNHPGTDQVVAVPDAVTELKLVFRGFEIDIAYGMGSPSVPEDLDVCQTSILQNLDDAGQVLNVSARGQPDWCRTTTASPCEPCACGRKSAGCIPTSSDTGGVNLALLAARVCQLYFNAAPSMLVYSFFQLWDAWQWSTPVMLTPIVDEGHGLRVWDERVNKAERFQLMKIITPAYPAQNSTFNVTHSTLHVLKNEFKRGREVCAEILMSKKRWESLWEPLPFFTMHKHYLQVTIAAVSEDDFKKWKGGTAPARLAGWSAAAALVRTRIGEEEGSEQGPNHALRVLSRVPRRPPSRRARPAAPSTSTPRWNSFRCS